jgi:hypothetical protein
VSFTDGRERLFVVLGNFCQFEGFYVPLELYLISLWFYIRRLDDDDDSEGGYDSL